MIKIFNYKFVFNVFFQIYKGLDIATNKVLPNEMEQIPHHLIDMIDPFQQFTVLDFQKLALKSVSFVKKKICND